MRVTLGYPDAAHERALLRGGERRELLAAISPALSAAAVVRVQRAVRTVHIADALLDYTQTLIAGTREREDLKLGLSPRAGQGLIRAAQRSRIRNQEIGFIFQSFNLIGDLTVYENVELPLTYRTGMSAAERKRRVQESLERVSMAHRMKHYPSQLSGGQQQRVAVARALAGSPSILLADEPTGNLDSQNGEAVMELLAEPAQDGATI